MSEQSKHMTVGELIQALQRHHPDNVVAIAANPKWPFEHAIEQVVPSHPDGTCWIAVGEQIGYLPSAAQEALDWDERR